MDRSWSSTWHHTAIMIMIETAQTKKIIFESWQVPKALAHFAIPMIISQLVTLVYNLADTFYLGRTGNHYIVAAVSLVLPIYNLTIAVANFFGTGGGSLIARLLGIGREDEARRVCSASIYLTIIAAFLYSLICFIFMEPLLWALGASSDTFGYARTYAMIIAVIGGIPTILTLTLAGIVRNAGYSKESGFGASLGGILNIILDPLFMFVLFPKGHELEGAAIATMLSNVIGMLYFILLIRKLDNKSDRSVLTLRFLHEKPSRESFISIISVGIPAALTTFLYDMTCIVINKLSATHGDVALAAIGVVTKAERLPLNIDIGICQGMIPLAAYNYSAGNYKRMKDVLNFSRALGLIISAICIVLYELGASSIMSVFIDNAQTVEMGTGFIRARCIATFVMFMSFHFVFFFQAIGQGRAALCLAIVRQLAFNIPMLFIFNHFFGMMGIVWTQFIADSCTSIVSFAVYHMVERRLKL